MRRALSDAYGIDRVILMPPAKYKHWTTPEGQEKIRAWVKQGLNDTEIAAKMGTTPQMLSKWRRTYKPIRDALIRLKIVDGREIDAHDVMGRPARKLSSVDKTVALVEDYEAQCKRDKAPMTLTGLALALGIDRDTLFRYRNEDYQKTATPIEDQITGEVRFLTVTDAIKRAVLRIEDDMAKRVMTSNNPGGAIFLLKNWYGYADKKDIGVVQGSTASTLSNDQIDAKLQLLLEKAGK